MLGQRSRDLISNLVCIGIGLTFSIGSIKYGDVLAGIPNPGFFPFVGGVILVFLALMDLLTNVKTWKEKKAERFFPQRNSLRKLLLLLSGLFFFAISLKPLGFFLSNLLLAVFLLRFIEPQKWTTTIMASLVTAVLSSVLFEILLDVQLPRGLFDLLIIRKWFM